MSASQTAIIAQLQREILSLEGYKTSARSGNIQAGLDRLENAFPNKTFPLEVIHEFICRGKEEVASTSGFIAGILSFLMGKEGVTIWISTTKNIFPTALTTFGVEPDKILFIYLNNNRKALWAAEEALKCNGVAAVVAELPQLDFTASRRLQLAVEKSRVTGFIIRNNNTPNVVTTSIARWQINSVPSGNDNGLPGVGHPCWQVTLLRVRNGRTGSWKITWSGGKFHVDEPVALDIIQLQKKTG